MSEQKKVVVIGGGITGLSTAYYLQKEAKEHNLPYSVELLEGSNRLGGMIHTENREGFTIERGPDSLLARKPSVFRLIDEVGLSKDLVSVSTGKSYVLANEKLHEIPSGSYMGIPVQVRPFVFSTLFSPIGKLRAAGDFIKPKSKPQGDQSLGHFFRNRLGDEVVENLIEPLLSGIYSGDIDNLSLMATFPNFYQIEQKYGGIVRGLQKTVPKPANKQGNKKPSPFRTLQGGLGSLVEAVADSLNEGSVHLETRVSSIEKKADGYDLKLQNGEEVHADSVVITTPHASAQSMLSQYSFMDSFKDMPATSVANVAMAFDQSAIQQDINGSGFLVSRNSDYRITACTWTHKKWPHTTPEGKALLRAYVGKPSDQGAVDLSDEEIADLVLKDLNKTMNITQEPEFSVVTRWRDSRAQYTVGHKDRLKQIKADLVDELPGVYLAGASYEGLGIPDCIDQGEEAVEHVLDYLKQS
ncbi:MULTISPECIES: protoporphyrinogen oxidase [Pontibacillus]|uniref:Coproporphyrinogen III oxidase n=1 Tax=Pontibacillus chungwhensis TaxID=265426 RepID=A0ABY8UZ31_9BACI|nr:MULTISPECIES: protoporphyrinogen oxidase [Pontibacillus]MCD5324986.1 protoporphyrinogen oxidase [Pontibacillus sp. HN14]WIF98942.1 protoporphyrinogen oxidase [Pontibacillus chungwhensis]